MVSSIWDGEQSVINKDRRVKLLLELDQMVVDFRTHFRADPEGNFTFRALVLLGSRISYYRGLFQHSDDAVEVLDELVTSYSVAVMTTSSLGSKSSKIRLQEVLNLTVALRNAIFEQYTRTCIEVHGELLSPSCGPKDS